MERLFKMRVKRRTPNRVTPQLSTCHEFPPEFTPGASLSTDPTRDFADWHAQLSDKSHLPKTFFSRIQIFLLSPLRKIVIIIIIMEVLFSQ